VTSRHEKEQGAIFAKSALQLPLNDLTSGVSKRLLSAVPNIESNSKHRFCTVVTWSNAHAQIHRGISSSLSQPLELFDQVAHILDVHVPLHYLNILYICQTLALHLRFRIELCNQYPVSRIQVASFKFATLARFQNRVVFRFTGPISTDLITSLRTFFVSNLVSRFEETITLCSRKSMHAIINSS
jgi:hypothetical protein